MTLHDFPLGHSKLWLAAGRMQASPWYQGTHLGKSKTTHLYRSELLEGENYVSFKRIKLQSHHLQQPKARSLLVEPACCVVKPGQASQTVLFPASAAYLGGKTSQAKERRRRCALLVSLMMAGFLDLPKGNLKTRCYRKLPEQTQDTGPEGSQCSSCHSRSWNRSPAHKLHTSLVTPASQSRGGMVHNKRHCSRPRNSRCCRNPTRENLRRCHPHSLYTRSQPSRSTSL